MIVGSAMGGIFGPGTLLQVHGLVETPELNGKLGKIQKNGERRLVDLRCGASRSVRPSNLLLMKVA